MHHRVAGGVSEDAGRQLIDQALGGISVGHVSDGPGSDPACGRAARDTPAGWGMAGVASARPCAARGPAPCGQRIASVRRQSFLLYFSAAIDVRIFRILVKYAIDIHCR